MSPSPGDPLEAIDWWCRAAEAGSSEARHFLGLAYLTGYGVPINESFGHRLIEQSARQGNEAAKKTLSEIRTRRVEAERSRRMQETRSARQTQHEVSRALRDYKRLDTFEEAIELLETTRQNSANASNIDALERELAEIRALKERHKTKEAWQQHERKVRWSRTVFRDAQKDDFGPRISAYYLRGLLREMPDCEQADEARILLSEYEDAHRENVRMVGALVVVYLLLVWVYPPAMMLAVVAAQLFGMMMLATVIHALRSRQ